MGLFEFIQRLLAGKPRGRPLAELCRRLGVTPEELAAVPVEYHQFTIPKRSGAPRQIDAPAPPLKRLQRQILRRVLARLPAHPAALGFERGVSFVDHARLHAGRPLIVRMDLRDFFPSIGAHKVKQYLHAIGWSGEAVKALVRLCCHQGELPQGAPTSPRLANLVNIELDARLSAAAEQLGALYSRYADDLVFSFAEDAPRAARALITLTRLIIAEEGYALNRAKGPRVLRAHQRQTITGLVVNDGPPRLSRETRRWLRAVEHRAATVASSGKRPTLTPLQREGWRALAQMVRAASVD